ncbi:MAG: homocysteine S-methyltransferase family protein [Candidatus Ranarchaeia archaeon]|jgi:methionine synthase I (cobalamin-dependent)
MTSNLPVFLKDRPFILDGGMGSFLMDKGLPPGVNPSEWNLTHPKVLEEIHQAYFTAGSDGGLTNTFGANPLKLKVHGLEDKLEEINRKGVEIVRKVCPPGKYVIGDIGPSGKLFTPLDTTTYEEGQKAYAQQAKILDDAGVDMFLIETQINLKEALIALNGVKAESDKPVFVSMTFEKKKRGLFTLMGDSPEKCVTELESAGASVIGVNCSMGSKETIEVIQEMKQFSSTPLLAKPNAGLPEVIDGKTIYLQDPADFSHDLQEMVKIGAQFIGGCCGTTPKFIRTLASNYL